MDLFNLSAILTLDTSQYEQKINMLEGATSAISGGVSKAFKLGAVAVGAATAAVGAFGAASVQTGMTFDKSMSQVYATMGDKANEMVEYNGKTVSSMEALRDFAQEMGRTTAFSASQSADALNYMALAGYDAETSIGMLPNVLNLAAAGNMDLARASDMVTDTQTAFGISLERTSQMVDEMAKASSTGNTSVEQLGDAFLVVGGLAKELNGGFVTLGNGAKKEVDGIQEMEIALTAMANAGIKGSEAGTHMRNMLLKLSSPTSDGTKMLKKLGVSVFDTEGNMRSLQDIMGDLNGALGNLTQKQKIQAISDLFNTRDLASAEALLGAVGEDWNEIGRSILKSKGAADEMAGTQLDNLAGDITIFKSALEGAQIAISDKLTPALRDFVQFGTQGLSDLTGAFKEDGLSGAMSVLGTVISDGLTMIINQLPGFIDAGIALLGAVGSGIIQNIPAITTALQEAGALILEKVIDIAPRIIETLWTGLTEGIPLLTEKAIEIMSFLVQGLQEGLPTFLQIAIDAIVQFGALLVSNAITLVSAGISILAPVIDGILQKLPDLITAGGTVVQSLLAKFLEYLPQLMSRGAEFILKIVSGIMQNLPAIISAATSVMSNLISTLMEKLPDVLQKGVEIIGKLVSGIGQKLPDLISSIAEAMADLLAKIGEKLPDFLQKGIELLGKVLAGIIQAVPDILAAIPGILSDIASKFTSHDWGSVGKNIINGIGNGIRNAADTIVKAAKDAAKKAFDAAKKFLGIESPSKLFRDKIGKMISAGWALGIEDGEGSVLQSISDLNDDMADGLNDVDYGATMTVTRSAGEESADTYYLRQAVEGLVDLLADIDENMTERLIDAFGQMRFTISGREFGRLVRDVRTA